MSKEKFIIAIDGPAAAGKSTIAKRVAKELNYTYIDTGAMYRAFTWYVISQGVDPKNQKDVCDLIEQIDILLSTNGDVFVNNIDVTKEIREPHVSGNVSYIASYKDVRLALVEQQRKLAKNSGVVMDGRDIGTYVLPNADIKIFQIASVDTRAKRRYLENIEKGIDTSFESIKEELIKRDYIDSHRDFAPLKQAVDAIIIDTSELTIDEVVNILLSIVDQKRKQ